MNNPYESPAVPASSDDVSPATFSVPVAFVILAAGLAGTVAGAGAGAGMFVWQHGEFYLPSMLLSATIEPAVTTGQQGAAIGVLAGIAILIVRVMSFTPASYAAKSLSA